MCFSLAYTKRHILSVCPIIGDAEFDHLAKVVSARLPPVVCF